MVLFVGAGGEVLSVFMVCGGGAVSGAQMCHESSELALTNLLTTSHAGLQDHSARILYLGPTRPALFACILSTLITKLLLVARLFSSLASFRSPLCVSSIFPTHHPTSAYLFGRADAIAAAINHLTHDPILDHLYLSVRSSHNQFSLKFLTPQTPQPTFPHIIFMSWSHTVS